MAGRRGQNAAYRIDFIGYADIFGSVELALASYYLKMKVLPLFFGAPKSLVADRVACGYFFALRGQGGGKTAVSYGVSKLERASEITSGYVLLFIISCAVT